MSQNIKDVITCKNTVIKLKTSKSYTECFQSEHDHPQGCFDYVLKISFYTPSLVGPPSGFTFIEVRRGICYFKNFNRISRMFYARLSLNDLFPLIIISKKSLY